MTGPKEIALEGSCLCGNVTWRFDHIPEACTACNCTACRRYGVLWGYDYKGEAIHTSGDTTRYLRSGDSPLGFHFCPGCGCVTWWVSTGPGQDGRTRMAVNLRLANNPDAVANIPVDHFDGFDTWADLPRDGRCVRDYWI